MVPPSGNGHLPSYHGQPININWVGTVPETGSHRHQRTVRQEVAHRHRPAIHQADVRRHQPTSVEADPHRHQSMAATIHHVGTPPFRRESSSGTLWPSVPGVSEFFNKPLPRLPPQATSRQTSSQARHNNQGGTLVQKVSRLPRRIADSLSSPTPTSSPRPAISRPLTRPQPSERETVLTNLAFELKQGGIDDLNGLLPTTHSPSPQQWRVCCQLLPYLDPDQLATQPRARAIGFVRSKLAISAFQLWTAYQILQGSGYLAHGMGLGKTHCVLAAVALKALISGSKKRCEEFWAMQSTRSRPQDARHLHLPRNAKVNASTNMVCPSQRPGDVQCWCVPGGVTRRLGMDLVPGASIISVPSDLMSDWVRVVVEAEFRPSTYNFIVVGGSNEVPVHLRRDPSVLKVMLKMSVSAKQATGAVNDTFDLAWTNRTSLEVIGTYIFLTSHHNSSLNDTFRYRPRDLGIGPNAGTFAMSTVYGAPIGLHFIDEAHLPGVWAPIHTPMLMAARHRHITGCKVWFVSGTPFPKDRLREVRAQVALLDPELTPALERLDERYQEAKYKLSPDKIQRFIRDFQDLFSYNYVLRFTDTTLFLDQPITAVQNIEPRIVSRRTVPSSALPTPLFKIVSGPRGQVSLKQIQKLVDRLQKLLPPHLPYVNRLESKKQVADVLYFISLFPAAAGPINSRQKLVLHDDAMREAIRSLKDRKYVTALPIVRENWARFAKDSPKLQYLREIIKQVNADIRPRPSTRGADGRDTSSALHHRKKCVVLTPNLSSAVFLFAWFSLDAQLRDVRPVFYHRDLAKRDKLAIRNAFNDTSHPRNYFIASAEDAGTGLNLQAASYQVLTSPLHRAADQAQAFRRTNRAGQQLPLVHKLLVLEDSPVDRINLVAQARRRFKSDPFDVLRGTVELWPVMSPASESSQEDLALQAGVRPVLREEDLMRRTRRREDEDDIYGAD